MKRFACYSLIVLGACSSGGGGGGGFVTGDFAMSGGDLAMMGANCSDNMLNGTETDVDCGGGSCGACSDGQKCKANGDCKSNACTGGKCQGGMMGPSCSDGVHNQDESDVDCGGQRCPKCANGKTCNAGTDCSSGNCMAGKCAPPPQSCNDGVQNNGESDIDCGGPNCGQCADGKKCGQNNDCQSVNCSGGRCQPKMVAKKPVGAPCAADGDCSGPNAKCLSEIPVLKEATPGGYCSNLNCVNNNDCGNGGVCINAGGTAFCLQSCNAKGQCTLTNANNRCFNFGNAGQLCFPVGGSDCNPTSANNCSGTGACRRVGLDDVGECMSTCAFGAMCADDANGNPQACYYLNLKLDANGMATGDNFSGLACQTEGAKINNQACTFYSDCAEKYECDVFKVSGSRVCKQLCKSGTTQCAQGTCQNAFKLPGFGIGSIGLCI